MSVVIEINPRVRELLEDAVAHAKPFWFGFTENGVENHTRLAVYFAPDNCPARFINVNEITTDATDKTRVIDGCVLSDTKQGPVRMVGTLVTTRHLGVGDKIRCGEGQIIIRGKLPS